MNIEAWFNSTRSTSRNPRTFSAHAAPFALRNVATRSVSKGTLLQGFTLRDAWLRQAPQGERMFANL
jgi:hypothetical protein